MSKKILVEEITAAQKKASEVKKVVTDVEAKLAEIEAVNAEAHITAAKLPAMLAKKAEIQADIAIGTGKQSDLDKITAEIEKAKADVAYHEETVEGLKAKLVDLQRDHGNFKDSATMKIRELIEAEADAVHQVYLGIAEDLLETFRQLMALSNLSKKVGGNSLASDGQLQNFIIPIFRVPSTRDMFNNAAYGCKWDKAVDMSRPTLYEQADEEAELAKLAAMGIQI